MLASPVRLSFPDAKTQCHTRRRACRPKVCAAPEVQLLITPLRMGSSIGLCLQPRIYQLGLVHHVREQLERVNEKSYEGTEPLQFRVSTADARN